MNANEHRLSTAVRDLLDTHRPAGIPADFLIRAEQETAKLKKPYLVVSAESAGAPHPLMRKMVLTLTTHRRADDESTGPDVELHQRFVNALESNLAQLATDLSAVQLKLTRAIPGETGEEIVAGRAESSSASWTVWLEIL